MARSLDDALDDVFNLAVGQVANQSLYQFAVYVKHLQSEDNPVRLQKQSITKLVDLFTISSRDDLYRRYAGTLLLELVKRSNSTLDHLRSLSTETKRSIGQVILGPNVDVLKILATLIIQIVHKKRDLSPVEWFDPALSPTIERLFPNEPVSSSSPRLHDFLEELGEGGYFEHADSTNLFFAIVVVVDSEPPMFRGSLPQTDSTGSIICELTSDTLTCTRLSTSSNYVPWFIDVPICAILRSTPHHDDEFAVEAHDERVVIQADVVSLNLAPEGPGWSLNGVPKGTDGIRLAMKLGSENAKDLSSLVMNALDILKQSQANLQGSKTERNRIPLSLGNSSINGQTNDGKEGLTRSEAKESAFKHLESHIKTSQLPTGDPGPRALNSLNETRSNKEDSENQATHTLGASVASQNNDDTNKTKLDIDQPIATMPASEQGPALTQVAQAGEIAHPMIMSTAFDANGEPDYSNSLAPKQRKMKYRMQDEQGRSASQRDRIDPEIQDEETGRLGSGLRHRSRSRSDSLGSRSQHEADQVGNAAPSRINKPASRSKAKTKKGGKKQPAAASTQKSVGPSAKSKAFIVKSASNDGGGHSSTVKKGETSAPGTIFARAKEPEAPKSDTFDVAENKEELYGSDEKTCCKDQGQRGIRFASVTAHFPSPTADVDELSLISKAERPQDVLSKQGSSVKQHEAESAKDIPDADEEKLQCRSTVDVPEVVDLCFSPSPATAKITDLHDGPPRIPKAAKGLGKQPPKPNSPPLGAVQKRKADDAKVETLPYKKSKTCHKEATKPLIAAKGASVPVRETNSAVSGIVSMPRVGILNDEDSTREHAQSSSTSRHFPQKTTMGKSTRSSHHLDSAHGAHRFTRTSKGPSANSLNNTTISQREVSEVQSKSNSHPHAINLSPTFVQPVKKGGAMSRQQKVSGSNAIHSNEEEDRAGKDMMHPRLLDEHSHRKQNIVKFGSTGPRNQGGRESPMKSTQRQVAVKLLRMNGPRPTSGNEIKGGMHGIEEEITPMPEAQDEALDARKSFTSKASKARFVSSRTGSQLSHRVSEGGSPYAKNTKLPLFVRRKEDLDEHGRAQDKLQPDWMDPKEPEQRDTTQQTLPPSRNPDNDCGIARNRTVAEIRNGHTGFESALRKDASRKTDLRASKVDSTQCAQSHVSNMPETTDLVNFTAGSTSKATRMTDIANNTDMSISMVVAKRDLQVPSIARGQQPSHLQKILGTGHPVRYFDCSDFDQSEQSGVVTAATQTADFDKSHLPHTNIPDGPSEPSQPSSRRSKGSIEEASYTLMSEMAPSQPKVGVNAVVKFNSADLCETSQMVQNVTRHTVQPLSESHDSHTSLRRPIRRQVLFSTQVTLVPNGETAPPQLQPANLAANQIFQAPSRIYCDQTAAESGVTETLWGHMYDLLKHPAGSMIRETALAHSSEVIQDTFTPEASQAMEGKPQDPRFKANERSKTKLSGEVFRHVSKVPAVDLTPDVVPENDCHESTMLETQAVVAQPKRSKFAHFMDTLSAQQASSSPGTGATGQMIQGESSEKTVVEDFPQDVAPKSTRQYRKAPNSQEHGCDGDAERLSQEDEEHDDISMSDHASSDDTESGSSTVVDIEEEEATSSDEEKEEKGNDPDERAHHAHLIWERTLSAHETDYYRALIRVAQKTIRHIVAEPRAANALIDDYSCTALDMIRRLKDSQAEDATAEQTRHHQRIEALKISFKNVLQDLSDESRTCREEFASTQMWATAQKNADEETGRRVKELLSTWG